MPGKSAAALGGIILALCLQITATVDFAGVDLRTSAADLVLPFGLLAVLANLLATAPANNRLSTAAAAFTHWRLPWPLLAAMAVATVAVFAVSIFVGKATTGVFSQWAVINKFFGWLALLAFSIAGYLIARGGSAQRVSFLRAFLGFAAIIGVITYVAHIVQTFGYSTAPFFISNDTRLGGLMTNPTAFAFLYAVVVVFHVGDMHRQDLWRRRYHIAAVALYLVLVFLSGSRSSWLGLGIGFLTLVAFRQVRWRSVAIALLIAIPMTFVALTSRDIAAVLVPSNDAGSVAASDSARRPMVYVLDIPLFSPGERGVEFRLDQLQRGLELWRAQPWLGIGLGSYIVDHAARGFDPPQHLHNSALWLLTETGITGAITFGVFFLVLLYGLWPRPGASPFAITVFAVLMVFVGVSIGTEALYQRHLWVLLGMALALPPSTSNVPSSTTTSKPAA